MSALANAYRWHRQPLGRMGATEALERARADVEAGRKRYPVQDGDKPGAPFGDGLQWCERPGRIGLRFVGYADALAPRLVDHTGWFTAPDGWNGEALRGAVYQLPGKGGRARLVAGYQEGSHTGRTWSENNPGSAAIALGEIFETDGQDSYWLRYGDRGDIQAVREAARRADQHAERMAEQEREYQAAWQAGSRWSDLGDAITAARREALALLREMKAAGRRTADAAQSPAICQALRDRVESLLEQREAAREKRAELRQEYSGRYVHGESVTYYGTGGADNPLQAAFNDGAGESVL